MDPIAKLITSKGEEINIYTDIFSVGRAATCNHVLTNLEISRIHCVLKKVESRWEITDKSRNGIKVNGNIIKPNQKASLRSGDKIELIIQDATISFRFVNNVDDDSGVVVIDDDLPTQVEREIVALAEAVEAQNAKAEEKEPKQQTSGVKKEKKDNDPDDVLDEMQEFTCAICSELFIKAVTLQCSHTFCEYCIGEWRKHKTDCPICRKKIISINPTLVVDNYIANLISTKSEEVKSIRQQIIKERQEVVKKNGGERKELEPPVEVSDNDSLDDDDFTPSDEGSDFDQLEFDDRGPIEYNGLPGRYYGGYGNCYICGGEGHWANGCPNR